MTRRLSNFSFVAVYFATVYIVSAVIIYLDIYVWRPN